MSTICIYHKGCTDGFGAAWVVRLAFQTIDDDLAFYPAAYQQPPPELAGKDVIIVDFSYPRSVMDKIIEQCRSLVILDHHKTAEADLDGIFEHPKVSGVFDMNHSGAMLAWLWYFPESEPPRLLKHIEDRDLWTFKLDGTQEIIAGLYSHPLDFELWDSLMHKQFPSLYADGKVINRQQELSVKSLIKATQRRMLIAGIDVPVANIPYMMASDAGHLMGINEPFAATYYDTPEGRVFSLRSAEGAMDVSEIAEKYNGGGHEHAAGFTLSFKDSREMEDTAYPI